MKEWHAKYVAFRSMDQTGTPADTTSARPVRQKRSFNSVAARASAFAANIEAQICQLEIELPWLECLDAQATANSVLAGAV